MAFIINSYGEKVNVDMEVNRFSNNCVLYSDNAGLREVYILNLYRGKYGTYERETHEYNEIDLVKQMEFWDKPPTKEEIMYEMWKTGLSRYDIATIEKGYMLDWKEQEG
jgi:hypothetical protein